MEIDYIDKFRSFLHEKYLPLCIKMVITSNSPMNASAQINIAPLQREKKAGSVLVVMALRLRSQARRSSICRPSGVLISVKKLRACPLLSFR